MAKKICCSLERGFTLVELVVVILIIGTLSLMAVAKFNSTPIFYVWAKVAAVDSVITYAKGESAQTECDVELVVSSAGGVSLRYATSCENNHGRVRFGDLDSSDVAVRSSSNVITFKPSGKVVPEDSVITISNEEAVIINVVTQTKTKQK